MRAMVAVYMVASMGCVEDPRAVIPHEEGGTVDLPFTHDAEPDRVDTGCDASGSCSADFPCGGRRFVCLRGVWWQRVSSRHCSFRCGCAPCTGQSCELDGVEVRCPEGTVCTMANLQGGMIDTRTTPCAPPVPVEDVAVRTARVRAQLVGTWTGFLSYPSGGDTFFTIELRNDGRVVLGCIFAGTPCTPFGFATTDAVEGQTWTLDEVNHASLGRGSLRLATTTGTLRPLSLENMVFYPNTEAVSGFSVNLPRDDAGVSAQYSFNRRH